MDIMPTWQWLAPECISGGSYNERSDTYSFGMVLYESLSRKLPFIDFTDFIVRTENVLSEEQLKDSKLLKELAASGYRLEGDKIIREEFQSQRIKIAIINEHLRPSLSDKWPKPLTQLIRDCWQHDPDLRPSFTEIIDICKEFIKT